MLRWLSSHAGANEQAEANDEKQDKDRYNNTCRGCTAGYLRLGKRYRRRQLIGLFFLLWITGISHVSLRN